MQYTKRFAAGLALLVGAGILGTAGSVLATGAVRTLEMGPQASAADHVPGEILVRFKPSADPAARGLVISRLGGRSLEVRRDSMARIALPPGLSAAEAAHAYRLEPEVEHAQPNYIYRPFVVPNDTQFGELWGLRNAGQSVGGVIGSAGSDMGMELAWDQLTDCGPAIVAVLDTGVNYTHSDLAANMWAGNANHGWDFVDGDDDPMPDDGDGHGTHVAGTIGAVGNNGQGSTGVCWTVELMAVRVMSGAGGTTASIVAGIDFAVANGASVINMSLGGPSGAEDKIFSDAIADAAASDVVVVVAAGNDGSDNDSAPVAPCTFTNPNLVCVAALDQGFGLADFSNWGAGSVDVGAPGVHILSTWPGESVDVSMTAGAWSKTGGWAEVTCPPSPDPDSIEMLVNPGGWCAGDPYLDNANDVAYQTFDLSGAVAAGLAAYGVVDTEPGRDFFAAAYSGAGGDPFSTGTTLFEVDGSGFGPFAIPLSDCLTSTCSAGFRLTSDGSSTAFGVAVFGVSLNKAEAGSTAYEMIEGTSMASPHVAGLAALIRAYNPDYTYSDVVASIKQGGVPVAALGGVTTTGRAAHAMGSLAYIRPPSGLRAAMP